MSMNPYVFENVERKFSAEEQQNQWFESGQKISGAFTTNNCTFLEANVWHKTVLLWMVGHLFDSSFITLVLTLLLWLLVRLRVELLSYTFISSTVYQWVAEVYRPLGLSKQELLAVFKVGAPALPRPVSLKERFVKSEYRKHAVGMWHDCHLQIADSVAGCNWFLQARGHDHNCGKLWDKMVQCDSATN